MSNNDNNNTVLLHKYFPQLVGSFTGALAGHVPRIWVNHAALYGSFSTTLCKANPNVLKGVGLNLTRSYASLFSHTGTREMMERYVGTDTTAKHAATVVTSACASTIVAATIETPFIRKSTPLDAIKPYQLVRINKPLTALYFAREVGFAQYLFGEKSLGNTLMMAGYTSICLTWIMWQATADMRIQGTIPDLSGGNTIRNTLKAVATGKIYSDSACKVAIQNPTKPWQLIYNLLYVSCSKHLYGFRLLHLCVLGAAIEWGQTNALSYLHGKSFFGGKAVGLKEADCVAVNETQFRKKN